MEYHCVITGQVPVLGGGMHVGMRTQTIAVPAGMTRAQVYQQALEALHDDQGWPQNSASIIFFSLEPNTLS